MVAAGAVGGQDAERGFVIVGQDSVSLLGRASHRPETYDLPTFRADAFEAW
jgi:hypothetical protein